jgi:phosphoketolase
VNEKGTSSNGPPLRNPLLEHRETTGQHGENLPEIRDWKWSPFQ